MMIATKILAGTGESFDFGGLGVEWKIDGDEVVEAGPGSWVYKPRHQWHTFWNAGDTPCHIIEVISPAGFEDYFRHLPRALTARAQIG